MGTFAARRRIAAAPHAPAVAVTLLGLVSVCESTGQAVGAAISVQSALVLCLLALSTTLPAALPHPAAAALTVSAASVLSLTLFRTLTVAGLAAQGIVLYRAGRAGRTDTHALAAALCLPFVVLALTGPRPAESEAAFLTVLLAALAPAAGLAGIAQRAHHQARVHNAARRDIADALREHTARGERARIARELHDVVAHHISMIAVQAETARLATPGMPAAGARRLSEIGDTARAGLTEMRRLLGVLREDAQTDAAERRPQPGLRQLNELLDNARDGSGAAARLIVSGPPVTLDPGVELAAYRIVQEALTNARRHAPGAAVDVELLFTPETLRLRIRDNGPGLSSAAPTGGHGLTGMRERAAAVGGELRAGHMVTGGFLIKATLPTTAGAP